MCIVLYMYVPSIRAYQLVHTTNCYKLLTQVEATYSIAYPRAQFHSWTRIASIYGVHCDHAFIESNDTEVHPILAPGTTAGTLHSTVFNTKVIFQSCYTYNHPKVNVES